MLKDFIRLLFCRAVLLGGIFALLLVGCASNDDDNELSIGDGRAFISMSFSTVGATSSTRLEGLVDYQTISDVLTETTTINEAQIHSVLVALFEPAGTDETKKLRNLFWFADESKPLLDKLKEQNGGTAVNIAAYDGNQESVMGLVSLNADKTLTTSTSKALWSGWYHTIIYGNFLSPKVCMDLLGVTKAKDLMDLTQTEVAAKGITLKAFKQAFASYATGPLSDAPVTGRPTDVYIKEQGSYENAAWDNLLGGYADNFHTETEATAEGETPLCYYHQSFWEEPNMGIHPGGTEAAPQQFSFEMNKALSKVRVSMTNIDENGDIYEGTDDYWLSISDGIVLKNWIPFAPTMQWADYDITPDAPVTYTVHDKSGSRLVTGTSDNLNVSWMQFDYTEFDETNDEYDFLANSEMADHQPYRYTNVFKLPLQYFLSRQNASYMTVLDETDPMNIVWGDKELVTNTGAVQGLTSTDPGAYNAQLFNCYIAPWSPLFPKQTEANATTIQLTLEKRDASGHPVAGSQRVYQIPLFNPASDPNSLTANLIDDHSYLRSGDYTEYTILRNYLYDIDIVFRGPDYGLKVMVSINPWNAAGSDEWVLYDLDAYRRSVTFEVKAQPAGWTDETPSALVFD